MLSHFGVTQGREGGTGESEEMIDKRGGQGGVCDESIAIFILYLSLFTINTNHQTERPALPDACAMAAPTREKEARELNHIPSLMSSSGRSKRGRLEGLNPKYIESSHVSVIL